MENRAKEILELLGGGKAILEAGLQNMLHSEASLILTMKGNLTKANLVEIKTYFKRNTEITGYYDISFILLHRSGNYSRVKEYTGIRSENVLQIVKKTTGLKL